MVVDSTVREFAMNATFVEGFRTCRTPDASTTAIVVSDRSDVGRWTGLPGDPLRPAVR